MNHGSCHGWMLKHIDPVTIAAASGTTMFGQPTLLLTGLAVRMRELRSCSKDRPCSFRMPTSSFALGRLAGLWSKHASISCAFTVCVVSEAAWS